MEEDLSTMSMSSTSQQHHLLCHLLQHWPPVQCPIGALRSLAPDLLRLLIPSEQTGTQLSHLHCSVVLFFRCRVVAFRAIDREEAPYPRRSLRLVCFGDTCGVFYFGESEPLMFTQIVTKCITQTR